MKQSTNQTPPGNLTERYIAAVGAKLPEKQRADIERELRATIADIADNEFAHLDAEMAERAVLESLGDPYKLAAEYRGGPQYLIGPEQYPDWLRLIKLSVFVGGIVALVVFGALLLTQTLTEPNNAESTTALGVHIGSALGQAIGAGVQTCIVMAAIVTVIFALNERGLGQIPGVKDAIDQTNAALKHSRFNQPWTVDRLPSLSDKRSVKTGDTIANIIAEAIVLAALIFVLRGSITLDVGKIQGTFAVLHPDFVTVFVPLIICFSAIDLISNVWALARGRFNRWIVSGMAANAVLGIVISTYYLVSDSPILNQELVTRIDSALSDGNAMSTYTLAENITLIVALLVCIWEVIDVLRRLRRDERSQRREQV